MLEPELDAELSAIASDAARAAEAPVVVVTVALERGRAFRARYELPTDVVVERGSDRDVALCDLVTMTGPLEIADASGIHQVPREAADAPGLRACLGVPVTIAGAAVGALCAIDLRPRPFSPMQRAELQRLAERAGRRAAAIAAERRSRAHLLVERTTAPVMNELRAMMGMVTPDMSDRLGMAVSALDAALGGGAGPVSLAQAAAAAESLAYPATGRAGGVRWSLEGGALLSVAPSLAASAVAAALSTVAQRLMERRWLRGIAATASVEATFASIVLEAEPLDAAAAASCAAEVTQALGGDPQVSVVADGTRLVVRLPTA